MCEYCQHRFTGGNPEAARRQEQARALPALPATHCLPAASACVLVDLGMLQGQVDEVIFFDFGFIPGFPFLELVGHYHK